MRARPEQTQWERLSGATFLGKLLVLPANVNLDWKVIARYKHSSLFGHVISNKGNKFFNIDTRSSSLSNMNRSAAPYTNPNLVSTEPSRESPLQLYKRSQLEYWKSPPPPFVPCPEPGYFADCLQNGGSPMQPKQRWRNQSVDDPILLLQGKSSPSSGSMTSRDSGCSEPFVPPNVVVVTSEQITSAPPPTLPVVVEKSESVEKEVDVGEDDDEDSVVQALRRPSLPPSSPCSSSSPVRSASVDRPGFSCKKRRSLFRDAMSELEDAIKVIQVLIL